MQSNNRKSSKFIMKRTGTNINIIKRIIERKLNFFGRICRMRDDRLLTQVLFCKIDGKNERNTQKKMDKRHDGLV